MTTEIREKDISGFSVSFKAQPFNEVCVLSNDELLASMGFPGRVQALDVYQNITSTRDAKNFVEITNNGSHPEFEIDGKRGNRLMRIMNSNINLVRTIKHQEAKT